LSEFPALSYLQIIRALQRNGFMVVRQKGSHIRLQKRIGEKIIKITVPAHKPVLPNTLRHILKQAEMSISDFKEFL
jgi:predicted RNA binding protein YcfA (HicA-like mRNA interferase family)